MTTTLQETAEMYAAGLLTPEQVEYRLHQCNEPYHSFDELPDEFFNF